MLATPVDKPFDHPDWIFEIKWDGYRTISRIQGSEVSIYSRNNISFNDKFPEIVESLSDLKIDAVLDGEIVVVDKNGKSDFQLLQDYLKEKKGNLVYYVFDILYLDGEILVDLDLSDRKKILKDLFAPAKPADYIRISDYIEEDGKDFFSIAKKNNLEGIIAKKKTGKYLSGKRSRDWLKIKSIVQQEVVIAGYSTSKSPGRKISSLITGVFDNEDLIFVGQVGTGFDENEINMILAKLDKIKTSNSPFKKTPAIEQTPVWVKPEIVAEVKFTEWTRSGLMRQPVYIGLRIDKDPWDVYKEKTESSNLSHKMEEVRKDYMNKTNPIRGPDLNNIKVELKHPDKIFWPEENYTKKDLFTYYRDIYQFIIPYIKDRLQSLNRCPDGIDGECFYQKDIDYELPEWLETKRVYSKSRKGNIDYLVCKDINSLLYMINLGCIDIHPWNSRISKLENPDYAVLDLDPLDVSFKEVLKVAIEARSIFDELKINVFFKTSGSKGIHVYIPFGAKYSYQQSLDFTKLIAGLINNRLPEITSIERSPGSRHKKVYLDCYQNRIGQTVAAPYSIRPRPGAPVSTPLTWGELDKDFRPADFNITNIISRLEKKGDLWKGVLGTGIDIKKCIEQIEKGISLE
jgi:bifunctional non-homologous end joining protein LigD